MDTIVIGSEPTADTRAAGRRGINGMIIAKIAGAEKQGKREVTQDHKRHSHP